MVLLANKDKAAVVIDTQKYKDKIKAMLADEKVYKRLKRDPTIGCKDKLQALLTGLKDQGKITLDQFRDLYPTSDLVPWLYGSLMIQKKGNPLHPIKEYIGSMAYATLNAIVDLLNSLIGKTI